MEILQNFERGFQGLIIPLAVQNVSITKIYSFDMFKQIWLIWYDRNTMSKILNMSTYIHVNIVHSYVQVNEAIT